MSITPFDLSNIAIQSQVSSEIQIGRRAYPIERWLQGCGCRLYDVKIAPAIGGETGITTRAIIYYEGIEPANSVAELFEHNMEDDVEIQCICIQESLSRTPTL